MSKYTTEVRYICETEAGYNQSQGYKKVNEILNAAAPKIFEFDYPIYDENYKLPLEIKILKHYYTREICEETVGLWKLRLDAAMNEIMPYFNQLYRSAMLEFNPLYDTELKRIYTRKVDGNETGKQESSGTASGNATSEGSNKNSAEQSGTAKSTVNGTKTSNQTESSSKSHTDKYADTPQGSISNLYSDKYLTNARVINDTESATRDQTETDSTTDDTTTTDKSSNEGSSTGKTTSRSETSTNGTNEKKIDNLETYIESVSGKQGGKDYAEMLETYRRTLINIDMMVIDALQPLFFTLY